MARKGTAVFGFRAGWAQEYGGIRGNAHRTEREVGNVSGKAERMLWKSHIEGLQRDLKSMRNALDRTYKNKGDIESEMRRHMKVFRRKCDAWRRCLCEN